MKRKLRPDDKGPPRKRRRTRSLSPPHNHLNAIERFFDEPECFRKYISRLSERKPHSQYYQRECKDRALELGARWKRARIKTKHDFDLLLYESSCWRTRQREGMREPLLPSLFHSRSSFSPDYSRGYAELRMLSGGDIETPVSYDSRYKEIYTALVAEGRRRRGVEVWRVVLPGLEFSVRYNIQHEGGCCTVVTDVFAINNRYGEAIADFELQRTTVYLPGDSHDASLMPGVLSHTPVSDLPAAHALLARIIIACSLPMVDHSLEAKIVKFLGIAIFEYLAQQVSPFARGTPTIVKTWVCGLFEAFNLEPRYNCAHNERNCFLSFALTPQDFVAQWSMNNPYGCDGISLVADIGVVMSRVLFDEEEEGDEQGAAFSSLDFSGGS